MRLFEAESILLRLWFFGEFEEVSGDVFEGFSNLCGGSVEEFAPRVDAVDAFVCEAVVQLSFDAYGTSEKNRAWTSKLNGTDASPSSRTRSMGSRRRVMPILTIRSPKDPMFEMT